MIKRLTFISVILLMLASCNQIPKEERVLVVGETDEVFVYSIPKAACVNCQSVVEDGLKNVKGVKQSILNLHTKEVSIVYQPELTSSELLEKKVKTLKDNIPCK